jgi:hypothetical protein
MRPEDFINVWLDAMIVYARRQHRRQRAESPKTPRVMTAGDQSNAPISQPGASVSPVIDPKPVQLDFPLT